MGKTYPTMESAKFGPLGTEIRVVGSMSPKVLVREKGVLVDKDGKPIAKEVRKLRNAIAMAKSKKKFDAVEDYQDELAALLEGSAYILDLSNMVLLFLDAPRPDLWDLIKPILSHDSWEMEHSFVDKVASGLEVKRVITRGWPACIFCSAKDESKWDIWPEIQSRFMVVSPNMTGPKFQAGNKLIGQKKGLPTGVKERKIISDEELEAGRKCFRYLKHIIQKISSATDSPVWIPYCELLAELLPADRGTDNRATNRLFSIIQMSAMSKEHLRPKLIYENEQLVIATLEDLQEALHVMQNVTGMPPHKLKFYQQYIVPLYQSNNNGPLTTKHISDFYNANAPKGTHRLNTENVRKTYLEELVNHSYLERQPDPDHPRQYLFTPLVDYEEEQKEESKDGNERQNLRNSGEFLRNLQYSKLLLPENHPGIAKDWLKQEILQLCSDGITSTIFKILDHGGNEVSIENFIKHYEGSASGLEFSGFFKTRRCFRQSNSIEIATLEQSEVDGNENTSTNQQDEDNNRRNQANFCHFRQSIDNAMLDKEGNNKGFFILNDLVYEFQIRPNEHWTYGGVESMLSQWLYEGKIEEIDPGKYRPTEKSSTTTSEEREGSA